MSKQQVKPDPGWLDQQQMQRRRRGVGRKVGAIVVAAGIGLVACSDPGGTPQAPNGTSTGPAVARENVKVDSVLDLNTGAVTPLPRAILRSLGPDVGREPWLTPGQYAASPHGSQLAYVGTGDDGSLQIFIAGLDGTGIRQVTHDPTGAFSPAWSPDGTRIAYLGYGSGDVHSIFVVEVATGESTPVTDDPAFPIQFTPDGSSILYTSGIPSDQGVLRTVPATGGKSAVLFDPRARGLGFAGSGSLSPDGSLVTFRGEEIGGPGALRFVANADGTDWRIIPDCFGSNPAGTWSPDGTRIVCGPDGGRGSIMVVNVASGDSFRVVEGRVAIWLDNHTLLVEA